MFDSLKERYSNLTQKDNKNSVAKFFQNPEYVQDKQERRTQILFYKLLMITAYADDTVEESELNLIKDYTYEQCLTEQEWREINFHGQVKATAEDISKLQEDIINEIYSVSDKRELLEAIRDIVKSDDIISGQEKAILESLEKKVKKANVSIVGNILRNLKLKSKARIEKSQMEKDSMEYSQNPISPVLKQRLDLSLSDIETISAKLGLALVIVHSDMEFHEKEKEILLQMISKESKVEMPEAEELFNIMIKIPDSYYEISHLSRILTESAGIEERKELLAQLFKVARADQVYDSYEDKYLRIISDSLLLSHKDFLAVKLAE